MAVFLGLLTAVVYGAGDFAGGVASRRAPAVTVVAYSQAAGAVLLLLSLPFLPAVATAAVIGAGAVAGLAGGAGVIVLYRGLAVGQMNVVAPITGVVAAALPVAWSVVIGQRPGSVVFVGVALALLAVVLVSGAPVSTAQPAANTAAPGPPDAGPAREALPGGGVGYALIAGGFFGTFFILLNGTAAQDGLWPLVGARATSIPLAVAVLLATRAPRRLPAGGIGITVLAGALDMAANVTYLLATRAGMLAIVAVLSSLYPVSTVALARIVLGERFARIQLVGLAVATIGVVLIGTG